MINMQIEMNLDSANGLVPYCKLFTVPLNVAFTIAAFDTIFDVPLCDAVMNV